MLHLTLSWQSLAELQEVVKVERGRVVSGNAYRAVEYDDALERVAKGEYTVCLVILLLLAYEEEAYAGIVYHVLYLLFGSRGVERYGDCTHAIGTKVGDEILYGVLREHADSVLRLDAEVEQSVGCLLHQLGETIVAHLLPYSASKVLVGEGCTVAILLSQLQGENRKMTSCLHNLRFLMRRIDFTTYMNMQKYAKKGERQNN